MDNYYQRRLKFGAATLVAAIPGFALLYLLQEIGGYRGSWTWYLSGSLFYTIWVFGNGYIDDESILLSAQDHRSKVRFLTVHCVCLIVLFALIQLAVYIRTLLPPSLLSSGSKGKYWLELLFFASLMAVFFIEENWLAVKPKKPRSTIRHPSTDEN